MNVSRNIAEAGSSALVEITENHASGTKAALKVRHDGTGDAIEIHGKISQRFGSAFKNHTHAAWVMGG